MKFILGTKQNMTQIFDENGKVHPVTILTAGPLTVTQLKTVPLIKQMMLDKKIDCVGAYYHLGTGNVEILR